MRIINEQRYKKQYVIGGSGIFDSVSNLLKKVATSNVAKTLAKTAQTALCYSKLLQQKQTWKQFFAKEDAKCLMCQQSRISVGD